MLPLGLLVAVVIRFKKKSSHRNDRTHSSGLVLDVQLAEV